MTLPMEKMKSNPTQQGCKLVPNVKPWHPKTWIRLTPTTLPPQTAKKTSMNSCKWICKT